MYFLLKMGILFQPAMLVYQRVIVELLKIQVCNFKQPGKLESIGCQASAPNALDAKANKYAVIWLQ